MRTLIIILSIYFAFSFGSYADSDGEKQQKNFDQFLKEFSVKQENVRHTDFYAELKEHFDGLEPEWRKHTQLVLTAFSSYKGSWDGKWGPKTENAMIEYVKKKQSYDTSVYDVFSLILKDLKFLSFFFLMKPKVSEKPNECFDELWKTKDDDGVSAKLLDCFPYTGSNDYNYTSSSYDSDENSSSYGSNNTSWIPSSDSSSFTHYRSTGNITYGSDGSSHRRVGNTVYSSDGTIHRRIGNTIFSSDGSRHNIIGKTLFSSTGETCRKIGSFISCF